MVLRWSVFLALALDISSAPAVTGKDRSPPGCIFVQVLIMAGVIDSSECLDCSKGIQDMYNNMYIDINGYVYKWICIYTCTSVKPVPALRVSVLIG